MVASVQAIEIGKSASANIPILTNLTNTIEQPAVYHKNFNHILLNKCQQRFNLCKYYMRIIQRDLQEARGIKNKIRTFAKTLNKLGIDIKKIVIKILSITSIIVFKLVLGGSGIVILTVALEVISKILSQMLEFIHQSISRKLKEKFIDQRIIKIVDNIFYIIDLGQKILNTIAKLILDNPFKLHSVIKIIAKTIKVSKSLYENCIKNSRKLAQKSCKTAKEIQKISSKEKFKEVIENSRRLSQTTYQAVKQVTINIGPVSTTKNLLSIWLSAITRSAEKFIDKNLFPEFR